MNSTSMIAGTALTSILFITLFGMVALIMNSAMAHTDDMLSGFFSYTENPTEQNRIALEKSIEDTDIFMKDIASISADYLEKYLDTIDASVLTDDEKQSIIEAKKMLDKIEATNQQDPDAIELKEKMENILKKLDETD